MNISVKCELLSNGNFKKAAEGWKTVNLSLRKNSRDAFFEVTDKLPKNSCFFDGSSKGRYFGHFRAGDIYTWLTLEDGILLEPGEYEWRVSLECHSSHLMFGMYSSKEVGCDDRLIPILDGSYRKDNKSESWNNNDEFIVIKGKYQMQWDQKSLPAYNSICYKFSIKSPTKVFPAIRGRAEAATNSTEDVGIQSIYIEEMNLKCVEKYDNVFNEVSECRVNFDLNNPVHDKNYAGLSAVFPCFWFLKDATLEKPYTEEQIRISLNKFLNMGIKIVRCVAFEPSYAWDSNKKCWDWQSEWMQGFYKYCDIMKENEIDIVLNTAEGLTSPISQMNRENPIYYLALQNNKELFENYIPEERTPQQLKAFHDELSKWVADFANEVILKRKYSNIKYWMEGTEVNNSSTEDIKFHQWMGWANAVHKGFKMAKIRDKIKIVGPATVIDFNFPKTRNSTLKWLNWCVEDYEEVIDIYAAHNYGFPYVMEDDISNQYNDFTELCLNVTKKSNKLFWHDEFNVLTDFGVYRESAEHPKHGTQIALGLICTILAGSNTTMLWYPVDIKWPDRDITSFPSWEDGIHILGLDKSILSGSAVPRYGYYVYCMLGTAIKPGDTVYKAEFNENNQLYTMLIKHKDENYSIVTVSMSYQENSIIYDLADVNNLVFERLEYDPNKFKLPNEDDVGIGIDEFAVPTLKNKIIVSDKQLKMEGNLLFDKIAPYNVVVYNQVTKEE